jgi:hypothetical protein
VRPPVTCIAVDAERLSIAVVTVTLRPVAPGVARTGSTGRGTTPPADGRAGTGGVRTAPEPDAAAGPLDNGAAGSAGRPARAVVGGVPGTGGGGSNGKA